MKKSLIALAALATVGAVQAQSSVTVYGILDAGYSDISRTVTGASYTYTGNAYATAFDGASSFKQSQQAFAFSNYTSSRFGLRGTEDLGGGTRASFVIETGISSNVMAGYSQAAISRQGMALTDLGDIQGTGTGAGKNGTTLDGTTLGNRELNARLDFNTGTTVGVGFGSTAIRNTWAAFDPAGGTNLVGSLLTNDAQFSSNRATGAGISQKLGDITVGAAFSQNNDKMTDTANTKTNSGYTLNLGYGKGPLAFAAAHQQTKTNIKAAAGTTTITSSEQGCEFGTTSTATQLSTGTVTTNNGANGGTVSANSTAAVAGAYACVGLAGIPQDLKTTTSIIAASYDMKVAKLFANYGRVKVDDSYSVNGAAEGKRDAYVLGAQVPMGKVQLFGLYSWGNNEMVTRGASVTTPAGRPATKRDVTGYTVGARYNMSKRTFAYAAVGETKLDAQAPASNSFSDREYGFKVQQTTVGLVHSF